MLLTALQSTLFCMCGMECAALTPGSKKLEKIILYQHSFFHRLYLGAIFLVYYFYYITNITIEIYKGEDSME